MMVSHRHCFSGNKQKAHRLTRKPLALYGRVEIETRYWRSRETALSCITEKPQIINKGMNITMIPKGLLSVVFYESLFTV